MDEADVLAEMFGRKPQPPEPAAAQAASQSASPSPPPRPGSPRDYALVAVGILLSAIWVLFSASSIDWMVRHGWLPRSPAGIDTIANLFVFGGLAGIAVLFMRLQPMPPAGPALTRGRALGLGLGLGFAGFLAAIVQIWAGAHVTAGVDASRTSTGVGLLLLGTLMVLFQAAAEELLFRGWLQARLTRLAGPFGAVAIAALAFSLLHIFGGARSPLALVNIFLAGLFFGLLMLRTGSLTAPIAAHFAWNWSETNLFGLSPNPGTSVYGTLFDFDLSGASYWGGTVEGLNAAFAVTIALIAVILPLLVWRGNGQPARS